jgi:hypothetical protein
MCFFFSLSAHLARSSGVFVFVFVLMRVPSRIEA